MTNQEFSDEFDVLYNNITSNLAPGLDEYEKSVFLTKALDEIVKAYFNPRTNKVQEGFDGSQRRQIDFSMLTKVNTETTTSTALFDIHNNSVSVNIPTDALMIINEVVLVTRDSSLIILLIIPIQYTEYTKLMAKPYKRPLKWLAWRLINTSDSSKGDIVIGANDTFSSYKVRYIKRPNPIILSDLEGVTIGASTGVLMKIAEEYAADTAYFTREGNIYISATVADEDTFKNGTYYTKIENGVNTGTLASSCELDPILHHEILQRAVELAKAAYTGDLNSQIALGVNSQTNMGMVTSNSK